MRTIHISLASSHTFLSAPSDTVYHNRNRYRRPYMSSGPFILHWPSPIPPCLRHRTQFTRTGIETNDSVRHGGTQSTLASSHASFSTPRARTRAKEKRTSLGSDDKAVLNEGHSRPPWLWMIVVGQSDPCVRTFVRNRWVFVRRRRGGATANAALQ